MTKLLDLDSIVVPKKEIQIAGKKYPVAEMTVGLFATIKRFEGQDIQELSITEQVAAYTEIVREVIPTVPTEVINKLNIEQLQAVFVFAMEQADAENEGAAGEDAK